MKPDYKYDIFISHSSVDKPYVRELAMALRDLGLKVWFDEWVIRPGDDIYLSIEQGLTEAQILLLCMSPDFFNSDWVGLERSTAIFRDPRNKDRRFIPLLLKTCTIPDALRRYKYIDLQNRTRRAGAVKEIFEFFNDKGIIDAKKDKDVELIKSIADKKDYFTKKRIYSRIELLRDNCLSNSSLLFLDIDRFTHINNTFGEEIGNAVLKTIKNLLGKIEGVSYCARWGGDEFICFLDNCSEKKALKIAKVVRNKIYTFQWRSIAPNLFVTASFGVAFATTRQSIDVVIERTILGSRNAKREGGNEIKLSPYIGLPRSKSYIHPVEYLKSYGS